MQHSVFAYPPSLHIHTHIPVFEFMLPIGNEVGFFDLNPKENNFTVASPVER
ncbi:hypothetical protein PQG02_09450 [Nostoc sp. UHCC 0926]|uniref:hypothetical protein n=1 Tax=unclassified Nostoc TaxID=2593658 RepID=UPI00236190B7|nr:hypothetical protein [Nostoc sp. UHCC 0926]WDD34524.1 hypothetical protein PQG02_09450 [Nostoc sp. UHCC 0926]